MSSWKVVKVGEVCDINKNSYSIKENWDFINYLDTGNITENKIENIQYFDTRNDKIPSRAKRKVFSNDIIYSTVRPNQKHYGIIKEPLKNMLVSTGFAVINGKSGVVDNKFLYYYLIQEDIVNMLHTIGEHSTSAYPSIKPSDIESIDVIIPPIKEQKAIADTLSCLDDKIELNNKINKNLEEMGQAIFKSWFVDFEPFKDGEFEDSELGKIPKGWIVGRADDYFEIAIGKTPPRKESKWFSANKNDVKWVSISDMGKCGMFILETSEFLTKESIEKHNIKIIAENTLLLSFKLTVGRVAITSEEMVTNEAIAHFKTDKKNINGYLYYYLKNFNYEILGNTSSIATAVNSKVIKAMKIIMPTEYELNNFHNIVTPLMITIRKNEEENLKLKNIRDSLLPKLMSGEIRVPVEGVQ